MRNCLLCLIGGNGTNATNALFKVFLVKQQNTTDLQTSSNDFQLQIYPNPSHKEINLRYSLNKNRVVNISNKQ